MINIYHINILHNFYYVRIIYHFNTCGKKLLKIFMTKTLFLESLPLKYESDDSTRHFYMDSLNATSFKILYTSSGIHTPSTFPSQPKLVAIIILLEISCNEDIKLSSY